MSTINVNIKNLKKEISDLKDIEKALKNMHNDLAKVKRSAVLNSSSFASVKKSLEIVQNNVEKEKISTKELREALDEIVDLYEKTEKKIVNSEKPKSKLKELIQDLCDSVDDALEYLQGLIKDIFPFAGDPVNMATGNFVSEEEELKISGTFSIYWRRFYNAMGNKESHLLGNGWRHNHDISVVMMADGYVRCDGSGVKTIFTKDVDGTYTNDSRKKEVLQVNEDGITITADGIKQCFNKAGRIIKVENTSGNNLIYEYDDAHLVSVKNNANQGIHIFYDDTKERLIRVETTDGRFVEYGYCNGDLVEANINGDAKHYEYDNDGTLLSVINQDDKTLLKNVYDEKKRVSEQEYPDGGKMKYAYEKGRTTFVAQNGQHVIYEHDQALRHVKTIYEDGEVSFTYNERNQKTSITDKNGNTTYYTYDDKGNVTSIIDCQKNKYVMTYNSIGKLISRINPLGAKTTFKYDDEGNMIEEKDALGNKTCFSNYKYGKPGSIVLPSGSQIVMEYDGNGNMISKSRDNQLFEYYEYNDLNQMIAFTDGVGNTTRYEYDVNGRVIKKIAANGMEQSFKYTASGKISEKTEFDGTKKHYIYNELNKVQEIKNSKGESICYGYDKMWNVSHKKSSDGKEYIYKYNINNKLEKVYLNGEENATFTYDANGNKTSVTTAKAGTIRYEYDQLNRLTKVVKSDGTYATTQYDKIGNVVETRDFDGKVTMFKRDLLGRVIEETQSAGQTYYYEYDVDGHVTSKKDQFGREAKWLYYQNGLLKYRSFVDGKTVEYDYLKNGKVKKEMYNYGLELSYEYDAINRVTKVSENNGSCKQYEYDENNNVTCYTDALGNQTRYKYDLNGRCREIEDPLGSKLTYTYDPFGNVLSKTWYGKERKDNREVWTERTTQYNRDDNGLLISKIDALGNEKKYTYNENNKIETFVDAEGRKTTLSYSAAGDMKSVLYHNEEEVFFEFDEKHRMVGFSDANGVVHIERDAHGRSSKMIGYDGSAVTYEWGEMGELRSVVYPDESVVKYEYDDNFKLAKIISGDDEIKYEYNDFGFLTKKIYPNHITSTYSYDTLGRVDKLVFSQNEEILKEGSFVYDACGNKTDISWINYLDSHKSTSLHYTYDELNRISKVYDGHDLIRSYEYDGFGNRVVFTEGNNRTEYSYNCNNQLITSVERDAAEDILREVNYNYDHVGNLCNICEIQNGRTIEKEFVYDVQNHVIQSVTEEGVSNYKYNGMGQLIERDVLGEKTQYIIDYTKKQKNIIGKSTQDGFEKIVWDKTLVASIGENGIKSVITDDIGSVSCVFDETGHMVSNMMYDEYGNIHQDESTVYDFAFTGYLVDEGTGTYYAQQRLYDAKVGRFNREDPLLNNTKNVQNQNLYTYCYNKPLTLVDIDGCAPTFGSVWGGVCDLAGDAWNGVTEVYSDAVESISESYDAAVDWCEDKWDDFSDTPVGKEISFMVEEFDPNKFEELMSNKDNVHYDRNKSNISVDDYTEICEENGWRLLPKKESIFHRIEDGQQGSDAKYNKKYVCMDESTGTSKEVIVCYPKDGDPYIVEDPINAGTYNYCDVEKSYIGHLLYDVLPYVKHGNQEYDSGWEYQAYRIMGNKAFARLWYDVFSGGKELLCLT